MNTSDLHTLVDQAGGKHTGAIAAGNFEAALKQVIDNHVLGMANEMGVEAPAEGRGRA